MQFINLQNVLKSVQSFKSSKWIALCVVCLLLGVFLVLTVEVREALSGKVELIGSIDDQVGAFLFEQRNPILNQIAIGVTELGSWIALTIISLSIGAYFIFTRRKMFAIHLLIVGVGSAILTKLLKFYFERSRPVQDMRLVVVDGFSYPSGHSLSSSAVYFTIAIILCRSIRERWKKRLIWMLVLLLITMIGITRIYLGVHYFSDVLAGVLLGVSWSALWEALLNSNSKKLVVSFEKL